jgi:hypothetical protein
MAREYNISSDGNGKIVAKKSGYFGSTGEGRTVEQAIRNADNDYQQRSDSAQRAFEERLKAPWGTYLD